MRCFTLSGFRRGDVVFHGGSAGHAPAVGRRLRLTRMDPYDTLAADGSGRRRGWCRLQPVFRLRAAAEGLPMAGKFGSPDAA